MILVLGILTLVLGCFPLGLVAFLMGKGDLEKMKKGTMDPAGESHTNIGRILGIVGFILGLIGTIIAFLVLPAMLAAGAAAAAAQDGALLLDTLCKHAQAARRRVLRMWLGANAFPVESSDAAMAFRLDALMTQKAGSGCVDLSGGWSVQRRYGLLHLIAQGQAQTVELDTTRYRLARSAETILKSMGLSARVSKGQSLQRDATQRPGQLPACATLSALKVGRASLYLRYGRPGDRMRPFGTRGSQKLQDIFVNLKVPQGERSSVPVLECRGEIVWIPGFRIAEGWQVSAPAEGMLEIQLERR